MHAHCTIWRSHTGEYIAQLLRTELFTIPRDHSHVEESEPDRNLSLRTPGGTIVGLANKQIRHGDVLLLFPGWKPWKIFCSGLLVRKYHMLGNHSVAAMIVGQCIVDPCLEVCQGGSLCECRGDLRLHDQNDSFWKVHMSPEDLLVFIAQDLRFEHP